MGYEHTPNEQNPQWTKHIQGVIHFKDRKRLSWLKNNISSQIHFEQQKGTNAEAINYCKKTEIGDKAKEYEEFGEAIENRQGERTDLEELIKQNQNVKQFALTNMETFCRYRSGIERIYGFIKEEKKKPVPYVIWLAGPTACGKTRYAWELHPESRWKSG